jgi:adenylate kinase
LVVLLFGPPGSGKGTQAPAIGELLGTPVISTGEMLRREIRAGTRLGQSVRAVLEAGQFVGDTLMNRLLLRRVLRAADCRHGFILDGYPRTVAQAIFLNRLVEKMGLGEPVVLHLLVPEEKIVARLAGRRQCIDCQRVYNTVTQPVPVSGRCACGGQLLIRPDDKPEVVSARLLVHAKQTGPVLDYYRTGVNCFTVLGDRHTDEVFGEIRGILEGYLQPVRQPVRRR